MTENTCCYTVGTIVLPFRPATHGVEAGVWQRPYAVFDASGGGRRGQTTIWSQGVTVDFLVSRARLGQGITLPAGWNDRGNPVKRLKKWIIDGRILSIGSLWTQIAHKNGLPEADWIIPGIDENYPRHLHHIKPQTPWFLLLIFLNWYLHFKKMEFIMFLHLWIRPCHKSLKKTNFSFCKERFFL